MTTRRSAGRPLRVMRRLLLLAALAAAILIPTPAAADDTNPYLVPTAPDANGCTGIEIHGKEGLVLTLPPWDGLPNAVHCAKVVGQQLKVFNAIDHRLVFTWRRYECCYGYLYTPLFVSYVWETNGHLVGTRLVASVTCAGDHSVSFVGRTVLVSEVCAQQSGNTDSYSLLTTDMGELAGYQPGAGPLADGSRLPLYAKIRWRIAYAANDPAGHGRELWLYDGAIGGHATTMLDINPGGGSSFIRDLVSHGMYATFTASDGHGRANWITDGTVAGTHKVGG
jgi:ELWxxDGT repeat protein